MDELSVGMLIIGDIQDIANIDDIEDVADMDELHLGLCNERVFEIDIEHVSRCVLLLKN